MGGAAGSPHSLMHRHTLDIATLQRCGERASACVNALRKPCAINIPTSMAATNSNAFWCRVTRPANAGPGQTLSAVRRNK